MATLVDLAPDRTPTEIANIIGANYHTARKVVRRVRERGWAVLIDYGTCAACGRLFAAPREGVHRQCGRDACRTTQMRAYERGRARRRRHPEASAPTTLHPLTELQLAILRSIAAGRTQTEIAAERGRSENTIKTEVVQMRKKLGAANAPHMVALAFRRGLLT